jgi:RNA polymerase sigma-70 factor (ECF subfamily)
MPEGAAPAPETWAEEHGGALYRFALGRVCDPELAGDLVQETFLEGLRARSSFAGRSSVRTWLMAILKHKILDEYRRSGRARKAEGDPPGHRESSPMRRDDDPEAGLGRREFWEAVGQCVLRLPDHLADAFVAIELGELGRDAACERLQITAANLSVRLRRARLMLQRCLEARGFAAARPHAGDGPA